jgi:nitroreductase
MLGAFFDSDIAFEGDLLINPVMESIVNRRSVAKFEKTQVDTQKLETILEAGRWAPSWLNSQPWKFIVVKDQDVKERLSEVVPTVFSNGMKEAPLCIAVVVNTMEDPYHFVEDGAAATQNMLLATHSLGLQSCWIGVFDLEEAADSAEAQVRNILEVPEDHHVISILPIGVSNEIAERERKKLDKLVYRDSFGRH